MDAQLLRARLLESGLATAASIEGCPDDDLSQIELVAKRSLPAPYREFMSVFGRRAGRFLRDIDILFPTVLTLGPVAIDIAGDVGEGVFSLPAGVFVFSIRRKEQFMFFGPGNDPSILFYVSGASGASKIADSFWDFIEAELELAEGAYRHAKGTPYDLRPSE